MLAHAELDRCCAQRASHSDKLSQLFTRKVGEIFRSNDRALQLRSPNFMNLIHSAACEVSCRMGGQGVVVPA
jgi:hypothetical protein